MSDFRTFAPNHNDRNSGQNNTIITEGFRFRSLVPILILIFQKSLENEWISSAVRKPKWDGSQILREKKYDYLVKTLLINITHCYLRLNANRSHFKRLALWLVIDLSLFFVNVINGIIQYVKFCAWFLSFCIMLLKFIRVVGISVVLFLFIVE